MNKNAVAILSLTISLIVLHKVHYDKPEVKAYVGDTIRLWYSENNSTMLVTPASFVNESSRIGTVVRLRAALYDPNAPSSVSGFDWMQFDKYEINKVTKIGEWSKDSDVGAFAIPPKSSIVKNVRFELKNALHLSTGRYRLAFGGWYSEQRTPQFCRVYSFELDSGAIKNLKEVQTRPIPLIDSMIPSKSEATKLLGTSRLHYDKSRLLLTASLSLQQTIHILANILAFYLVFIGTWRLATATTRAPIGADIGKKQDEEELYNPFRDLISPHKVISWVFVTAISFNKAELYSRAIILHKKFNWGLLWLLLGLIIQFVCSLF